MLGSLALLGACLGLLYSITDWHASVKNNKTNLPSVYHHHNARALVVTAPPSSLSSFWSSSFSSSLAATTTTTATASNSEDANSNAIASDDKKNKNDPDDFDGDAKCRAYLLNFLNGTTDAQDECAGMYHAYSDSDCKDEIMDHNLIRRLFDNGDGNGDGNGSDGSSSSKNNDTDPVVTMDDVFEEWDCCEEISAYYTKHCQEDELLDASRLLAIVGVFILCGLVQSILRVTNFQGWIPDAGACILVGAVVGGVARLIYPANVVRKKLIFNSHLFLQILLPPIIFQAALSIDKRAFRRDLFPILLFAICGTAFAAISIALVTFHLSSAFAGGGKNGDNESSAALPLLDCLLFGSLMSSIDPVATLSILSGVGASKSDTLYTLVFGESLLNDGVSIVLFDSFLHIMNADNQDDAADSGGGGVISISSTLYHVVFIAVGSILVGLICGAICNIFFWLFKGMHTAVTEVALFFTWALVPYYIADGLELSGIISILTMAFVLDSYVIGGSAALEERRERQLRQQLQREQQAFEYRTLGRPISNEDNLQELDQYSRQLQQQQQQQQQHYRPPRAPVLETLALVWSRAFSGHGHLLELSCNHVGFVAKVMASLMETAIFAYLGLFLFNDNGTSGQLKFTANGIFACVSSRVVMVIGLSMLVNFCVLIDLEDKLGRLWACFVGSDSRSFRSRARLVAAGGGGTLSSTNFNNNDNNINAAAATSIRLNDPPPTIPRSYLTPKTQLILILSGVRGAVSYALVQNIPVYDSVTKHGSHFKGELRAMTSGTIVVILFVFGALTYFSVGHEDAATTSAQDDLHGLRQRRPRSLGGAGGDDSDMSQLLLREDDTYNEATGAQHDFSGGHIITTSNATSLEIDFRGQQRSSSTPGQLS
jgi:NhaP-type Na+/H+ or K+/H+ antiporter